MPPLDLRKNAQEDAREASSLLELPHASRGRERIPEARIRSAFVRRTRAGEREKN